MRFLSLPSSPESQKSKTCQVGRPGSLRLDVMALQILWVPHLELVLSIDYLMLSVGDGVCTDNFPYPNLFF